MDIDYRRQMFWLALDKNSFGPFDFNKYLFGKPDSIFTDIYENNLDIPTKFEIITHETIHFVQDFTMGCLLNLDLIKNSLYGSCIELMHESSRINGKIKFPLKDDKRIEYLTGIPNYFEIDKHLHKPGYHKIVYEKTKDVIFIDYTEILEAHADAKTALHCFYAYFSQKNLTEEALLETFENMKPYRNLSKRFIWKKFNGSSSVTALTKLIGFIGLCEFALHTPPVISYQEGANLDIYTPVTRFLKGQERLFQNKGFPDAIEGESFFLTLFDFFADDSYPSLRETDRLWFKFLSFRMSKGFMISDVYRFLCLEYRFNSGNKVFFDPPSEILRRIGIPVPVCYYDEHEISFDFSIPIGDNNNTWNIMPFNTISDNLDPIVIMNDPAFVNHWSLDLFENRMKDKPELVMLELAMPFLKETFCRDISNRFFEKAFQISDKADFMSFGCPMLKFKCSLSIERCSCLTNIRGLPNFCPLCTWLSNEHGIDINILEWSEDND